MLSIIKITLAFISLCVIAAQAQAVEIQGSSRFGLLKVVPVKPSLRYDSSGRFWRQRVELPPSLLSYVIRVRAQADISSNVTLSISDGTGQVSRYGDVLSLANLRRGQGRLTPVLRIESGYQIDIELRGSPAGTKPLIQMDLILLDQVDSAPLTGVADAEPLTSSDKYIDMGKSVARLVFPAGSCTGFAITGNLLLTNNHCAVNKSRLCEEVAIEFNAISRTTPGNRASCLGLYSNDSVLDYALIRFKADNPVSPVAVFLDPIPKAKMEYVVIHHPWGQEAMLSSKLQTLERATPDVPSQAVVRDARSACGLANHTFASIDQSQFASTLGHKIDTDPGSSGSPILVGAKAIALHFDMDRRLYLNGWTRPDSAKFDCLKSRAGYGNWSTDLCQVLRHASLDPAKDAELVKLASSCKR